MAATRDIQRTEGITMRQRHACSPEWCWNESIRLFPLDLPARLAWLHDAAFNCVNESDRFEIERMTRRLRQRTHLAASSPAVK